MKKDVSGATVIRAWSDEYDKKITLQIEDLDGETLAFIQLSPDKASYLSDCLAVYAAKLKLAARQSGSRDAAMERPALLC